MPILEVFQSIQKYLGEEKVEELRGTITIHNASQFISSRAFVRSRSDVVEARFLFEGLNGVVSSTKHFSIQRSTDTVS